ncbi:hypothetical protein [Geomesophilobacter sediminis]|uniref:Uncharacterized protein n=1 Tax=Geomesophilobacter sediminis TaxID=2798584 RepID=A0A8J7M0Y3_9BACT|nr:hypothetical protein [Geomesophilobacter sediminis]MBJ6726589.1 hypothetical protein [Geomesophilobacter sediminis]
MPSDNDDNIATQTARLAHRSGQDLSELLKEGDADLLRAVLRDPRLEERHVMDVLRRRDLPADILKLIARLPLVARNIGLKIAVAAHPRTSPQLFTGLLPQFHLFELVALIQHPGVLGDHKAAAERAVLKLIPDTPLGNKVTMARRGSLHILEALLAEPEIQVVEAVLSNPVLRESALLSYVRGAAATPESISAIARHRRWGHLPSVRRAMLQNAKTPAIWFTLFLPEVATSEVERLLRLKSLGERQREEVEYELRKRRAEAMLKRRAPSRPSEPETIS